MTPSRNRFAHRLLLILGAVALIAVLGGGATWLLFFAGDAPRAASIDDAIGAVGASPSPAAMPGGASPASSPPAAGSLAPGTVDGRWVVDSSIGSFADFTGSWAGFRVDEELANIGSTTAIGRTPAVAGELTLADTTLSAAHVEIGLTEIRSDRSRRDGAIQRALETETFPSASFELTESVELGAIPADGVTMTVQARGTLTIHGVARPVTFALDASLVNGTIVVVGSTEIRFADYGVRLPTAPVVLSIQDHGIVEVQLFFRPG
jgi:polyisoprenoid-binding protein YceI